MVAFQTLKADSGFLCSTSYLFKELRLLFYISPLPSRKFAACEVRPSQNFASRSSHSSRSPPAKALAKIKKQAIILLLHSKTATNVH